MVTDWHKLWQHEIFDNGKQIPVVIYRRQQNFESLSAPAQALLFRLEKRKKQSKIISLREITKGLVPKSLSQAATVRALMQELTDTDFVRPCIEPICYGAYRRAECWKILCFAP